MSGLARIFAALDGAKTPGRCDNCDRTDLPRRLSRVGMLVCPPCEADWPVEE